MSIKAKIKEIKASGVLVELENGEEGWLSGHELSLNYEHNIDLNNQNLCKVDQELEVVCYSLEIGKGRRLVSHIRANNDPWKKVKDWQNREVKEMKVYSVTNKLAFGKIESGIEAFITLSDVLPNDTVPESLRAFSEISPGDSIAGYVYKDKIELDNRLVPLDFLSYIKDNIDISEFLPIINKVNLKRFSDNLIYKIADYDPKYIKSDSINNIFVLDNEDVILNGIVKYLKSCGYNVYQSSNERDCKSFFQNEDIDIDLSIIDIHLSPKNDYIGLNLINFILEKQPRSKFILISAEDMSPIKNEKAGELLISGYLIKPFGAEELRNAISFASLNKPQTFFSFFESSNHMLIQNQFEPQTNESLKTKLENFRKEINADTVVLFQIHPLSYNVKIKSWAGPLHDLNRFLNKLRYSPVRDVSIDREIIHVSKPNFTKHRYLYQAIKYESCLAFPIDTPLDYAYSIFAFHPQKNRFDQNYYYRTKVFAIELATLLTEERNVELKKIDNPFLLAGKTYASMAHELMNNLSGEFCLNDIINKINHEELDDEVKCELTTNAKELLAKLVRAKEIIKEFRDFSRSHRNENPSEVCVNEVIDKVKSYLFREAANNGIQLNINIVEDELYFTEIRKTAIEQVVFNLTLNAIDQIKGFNFYRTTGSILIELSKIEFDNKDWVQILVHDTGPGIRKRDFNKIFDTGFTSKTNGAGLRLDICRNIIDQAKGKIGVLKSVLFIGTTFQVLLPLIIKDE